MKYLMFNLSGPLQAWGGPLPGMARTIEDHPTKSGVVGFLGACLGISRETSDELTSLANQTLIACRVDAPGYKISDFHIVKNTYLRYHSKAPNNRRLKNILTLRDYLCNAVFTMCIQHEDVDTLYNAIRQPVYTPFLGRKSCLPNYVFPRIIEAQSIHEAFKKYNIAELHKELLPVLSQDNMVRVFWEGSDSSISPIRKEWKYDVPNGSRVFKQRLELMGYMKRMA